MDLLHGSDLEITQKFCAVVHRASDGGNAEFVRAYDSTRRRIERGDDAVSYIRLHGKHFVTGKNPQAPDPVFFSACKQCTE